MTQDQWQAVKRFQVREKKNRDETGGMLLNEIKYTIIVRNKLDNLLEKSERHTLNDEYENFVTM